MKRILLRSAFLLCLALPASAQNASMWKHLQRPDIGATLRFITLAASDTVEANDFDNRIDLLGFGGIGGFNLPFLQLADDMSLGLNLNGVLAAAIGLRHAVMIEFPMYLTYKWGTDATWGGSKSWIGGTVGVGYDYNVLVAGIQPITYGVPSMLAEVNFGKRRGGLGLIKLRYSMGFGSHIEKWTEGGTEYEMFITEHAFDILITSGY